MISLLLALLYLCIIKCQNTINGKPHDTDLTMNVTVIIEDKEFNFSPKLIPESYVASKIFKPGHFSILDCLVYLYKQKLISSFEFHFDQASESYVIDVLNVEDSDENNDVTQQYWWYHAHYDQGNPKEVSAQRMSYYLVKDLMYIKFCRSTEEEVSHRLDSFTREVERTKKSGGEIIIPVVYFNRTDANKWNFTEVSIPRQNNGLRDDLFYNQVITAADVFLTLGNENKIQDEFLWYVHLWDKGHHDPNPLIKAYRVESINGYTHSGACGWVFEFGEWVDETWAGNMIHVQPDEHIMMFSPEYFMVFWIELGQC